jgi:hypothetical protein
MTDSGKEADWTVMVYLAGDNNLTAECIYALTEMKKVKTGGRINIIAQFDPQDDYLPTRRFEITSDQEPGKLLKNDLGGAPFEVESEIAQLRAQARIAGLKAGATAATKTAVASFKAALASLNENSERASGKFTIADKKLEKSFQFDLSGDGTLSSEIENERERETDTGSPTTLYNFLSHCVANFKAKHYMVVLSGHGSGTERDFLLRDESPEGYLTFNELRRVFEDLKPELGPGRMIDILGLDSCLMSMAEVCYELKGLVQILIGSESFSPASGWPYREVLQRLVWEIENIKQNDEKDLQTRVAKGIVEEYVNFYADYWLGGISVDQSALDVTKVGYLKDHIDKLAKALTDEFEGSEEQREKFVNALVIAHWEAQSYNGEQFVDLADFCRCLSKRYNVERITGPCRALANLITPSLIVGKNGTLEDKPPAPEDKKTEAGTFVLKSCFSGPVFQYSYGVSIYFPWARVTPDYHELSFVKDTEGSGWAKFLQTYTEETRRSPRNVTLADVAIDNFSSSNTTLRPQRFRKVEGKGAENPVYSMRNPPLIVIPDFCIEERESIINGMKKILAEAERSKRTQERARNANDADHSADDS